MVDFGWSYPPGCNSVPGDEDQGCSLCGKAEEDCECPECPGCGDYGNKECYGREGHLLDLRAPRLLWCLRDLCGEVCGDLGEGDTPDHIVKRIRKRLFKSTDCGIGFAWRDNQYDEGSVVVSGYCEGSDAELPTHELVFPFTAEQFWAACEVADKEGVAEWDRTHGCEYCWQDGYCTDVEELSFGNWPINPDCPHCKGEGVVL